MSRLKKLVKLEKDNSNIQAAIV